MASNILKQSRKKENSKNVFPDTADGGDGVLWQERKKIQWNRQLYNIAHK